jgi:hypothetical protein
MADSPLWLRLSLLGAGILLATALAAATSTTAMATVARAMGGIAVTFALCSGVISIFLIFHKFIL